MDKRKCSLYNIMWQLNSTLLKKLKQLAAQFGTKIKIKPIRAKIVPKQAYSLSLKKRNVKLHLKKNWFGTKILFPK